MSSDQMLRWLVRRRLRRVRACVRVMQAKAAFRAFAASYLDRR